jgi:hypothetical protein
MADERQKWLNKNVLDILSLFTYDYSRKIYAAEASKELNIAERTVSRKLNQASSSDLIRYRREGKNKIYFLDLSLEKTFHILMHLEAYKTIRFLTENPKIGLIIEKYDAKLIFGSYARFKKGSDLDVVFFDKQGISEDIIHEQITTKKKFKKALFNRATLALEIAKNHIILSDYEYFVRLFMEYYNG